MSDERDTIPPSKPEWFRDAEESILGAVWHIDASLRAQLENIGKIMTRLDEQYERISDGIIGAYTKLDRMDARVGALEARMTLLEGAKGE